MLSNTSLDFISDMRITDQKHYERYYRKKNIESSTSGMLFKKYVLLELSYFARNIYETEILTSGLYYIENLIFHKNEIV